MIKEPLFKSSALLLAVISLLMTPTSPAQESAQGFSLRQVSAAGLEGEVRVVSEMDLILSEPVEEAVKNGIPVTIVKQFGVPRSRLVLKRRRVKIVQTYELRRHALSDRYIVTENGPDTVKTYPSVNDALRAIGGASIVTMQLGEDEYHDPPQITIRVFLDIYALPTALRMRAFISRNWRHSSGWTVWNIEP
jgi:hypothetical protein